MHLQYEKKPAGTISDERVKDWEGRQGEECIKDNLSLRVFVI